MNEKPERKTRHFWMYCEVMENEVNQEYCSEGFEGDYASFRDFCEAAKEKGWLVEGIHVKCPRHREASWPNII